MAYLQSRKNKEGQVVSYSIRVYKGEGSPDWETAYALHHDVARAGGMERKAGPEGGGETGGRV